MTSAVHRSSAGQGVVPYTTTWTGETAQPCDLVEVPGRGIAYADESLSDRDRHGVLWSRSPFRPGQGRPEFGQVHPLRQRRAMLRLLCQVCAGPANRTAEGVLWLVRDYDEDWPNWPERMAITEPPVCLPCARLAMRACPALRRGAAAFRARRFPIIGVRGGLYTVGLVPHLTTVTMVRYDDPAARWVVATSLLRELHDCTRVNVGEINGA